VGLVRQHAGAVKRMIVCRCEDVTYHELKGAMTRGYRDIESLKRYTGFGTGWCQGKWCLSLCARIITEQGGDAAQPMTPRPPYHPVALASLTGLAAERPAKNG